MNRPLAALALAAALAAPTFSHAAAPAKPDTPATRPARQQGDAQVNRMGRAAETLELTDEQKAQIKDFVTKANKEVEEVKLDYAGASRQELAGALRGVYEDLKQNILSVLTDAQKPKFEQAANQRGGGQGGRGGNMMAAMQQLDLSDEQKTKIRTIIQDSREQMQTLRQDGNGGDRQAMREKYRTLMEQTRTKVNDVLTDEQKAKLKELMPEGGQGGRRGRGN